MLRIKMDKPFRTSVRSSTHSESVILLLKDDEGNTGLGEGVPTYPYFEGEALDDVVAGLKSLAKTTLGGDYAELGSIIGLMSKPHVRSKSALAAFDIALHDLFAKTVGVPLCRLLGLQKDSIETSYTIGIASPEEMAKEAKEMISRGFRRIKIKVGTGVEEDIKRVKAVAEVLGDRGRLSVDANQAYSIEKATALCGYLSRVEQLEFLEQPLPKEMVKETATLRKRTGVKVMLDESIRDAKLALSAVQAEAADYVNVKLMKVGGIMAASDIASVCRAGGVRCMVGCYSENSIGIAAGAHFALGTDVVTFADLDSDIMCPRTLAKEGGAWVKDGKRGVEQLPGLGISSIDESLLGEQLFVERAAH